MTLGDVVTVADCAGDCTGKPRPDVIVQSNLLAALNSVTVGPLTSGDADALAVRLMVQATAILPIDRISRTAIDKIRTVRRGWIGPQIGRLSAADMRRVNGAMAVFLGIGD